MGQKVHPKGFRLGVIEGWESRWFAEKEYAPFLHDDIRIRNFIKKRLQHAGIAKVEIERAANKAKINIHTARPGIVIGKKGVEIEKLKAELAKLSESFDGRHWSHPITVASGTTGIDRVNVDVTAYRGQVFVSYGTRDTTVDNGRYVQQQLSVSRDGSHFAAQ